MKTNNFLGVGAICLGWSGDRNCFKVGLTNKSLQTTDHKTVMEEKKIMQKARKRFLASVLMGW